MPEYDPFNLPKPTAEERQHKHFLDSNEKRVGWVAKTLFLI